MLVAGGLSDEMLSQIASERPPPSAAVNEAAGTGGGALMSAEHVRTVMEDCQRVVVPDDSRILGCWGLIDADEITGTVGPVLRIRILLSSRKNSKNNT